MSYSDGGRRDPRNRNSNDRRDRFRRRRRRDQYHYRREEKKDYPLCPMCEKQVTELANAMVHKETLKPAHFDCVMKSIEATESVTSNEKICYLGKGSFGIVRFQKIGGSIPFVIRKRIQYEDLEEAPEWRKQLDKCAARDKKVPPPVPPVAPA